MFRNLINSRLSDLDALGIRANRNNPLDLVGVIRRSRNNQQPAQEIRRDTMGGDNVVGAADGAHAAVGGEDHDGRDG